MCHWDIDIVVVPPETAEASDEEGNDNILNHDNDDLPCDSADNSKKSKNADELNIGDWELIEYEDDLYSREVKTLCSENVTVDVMVSAREGKYKWPSPKHIHNYTRADIKRKILQPIPYGNRASQFYFPNV
ncbi:hypothetical protein AVEN_230718-1 [Araneus ventricosus]|uniref:Uncharacterized protein n=1 Tax=Araneus ventricosus TaxID=182803 RepID=A0A4Y2A2Z1_ARAVE|nr:hypothetical protein AVEN_230718-1 [Araneus ventricosus]